MIIHTDARYDMTGRKRKSSRPKGRVYQKRTQGEFKPYVPPASNIRRTAIELAPSVDTGGCSTGKKESIKYTGTLVVGIATMHKSNAVPVINQQEATDIARMRR